MKRGFTLIELLAVIVILAIIALIATPIILNIIKDSKTSSDEQTVELYLDTVEKIIIKKQLSNPNFNPNKCEIKSNGNLEFFKDEESLGITEIEMKGKVPNDGTITIQNGIIKYKNIVFNDKIYYEVIIDLIEDIAPVGLSKGDKYEYRVNDKNTFNFYILSVEDDKVNLIMDRNICENGTINYVNDSKYCRTAFSTNSSSGPDIAMNFLYNATKDWKNVPNIVINYESEFINFHPGSTKYYRVATNNNYVTKIIGLNTSSTVEKIISQYENLKARLPMHSELVNAGCTSEEGSCPTWLIEGLKYSDVDNNKYSINNNSEAYQNIIGYWTFSEMVEIKNTGNYKDFYGHGFYIYDDDKNGIRPVITILIDDLVN